jgi:hypothetical protein
MNPAPYKYSSRAFKKARDSEVLRIKRQRRIIEDRLIMNKKEGAG